MIPRLCLVTGLLCIIAALVLGGQSLWFWMSGVRVEGTLDRIAGDNLSSYFVVRYESNGRVKELESHRYRGTDTHWRVGMPVTVLFPPDRPEEAQIFTFAEQLGAPIMFTIAGAGLLLYGRKVLYRPPGLKSTIVPKARRCLSSWWFWGWCVRTARKRRAT